jgi:hypothetical protein
MNTPEHNLIWNPSTAAAHPPKVKEGNADDTILRRDRGALPMTTAKLIVAALMLPVLILAGVAVATVVLVAVGT